MLYAWRSLADGNAGSLKGVQADRAQEDRGDERAISCFTTLKFKSKLGREEEAVDNGAAISRSLPLCSSDGVGTRDVLLPPPLVLVAGVGGLDRPLDFIGGTSITNCSPNSNLRLLLKSK